MSVRLLVLLVAGLVAVVGLLSGCSGRPAPRTAIPPTDVPTALPPVSACRVLSPAQVDQPSDATPPVPCRTPHTAETYAVGLLPSRFAGAAYDDRALARFAYRTCARGFAAFLGADDSVALRTLLTWAWFRPSSAAWRAGARWYRCDVVGGGDRSSAYADLPVTARGLLRRTPDQWMACTDTTTLSDERVPCTRPHRWRAVTTIMLGDPGTAYPGDAAVAARTKDYCASSVKAWLGYPLAYDYGYTSFHAAEWAAGGRRSVCWARTAT